MKLWVMSHQLMSTVAEGRIFWPGERRQSEGHSRLEKSITENWGSLTAVIQPAKVFTIKLCHNCWRRTTNWESERSAILFKEISSNRNLFTILRTYFWNDTNRKRASADHRKGFSLIESTRKNSVLLFLEKGTYSASEKTWIVIPKGDWWAISLPVGVYHLYSVSME